MNQFQQNPRLTADENHGRSMSAIVQTGYGDPHVVLEPRVVDRPQVGPDEDPLRWNWDSALIISPHDHERLYYACQKVFRSDDMGHSWTKISEDLTSGVDRNKLEVMGRVWSVDAVAKNDSTSMYGAAIGLSESPLVEGLIYVGTDDGVMSVTEDGGANWRRVDSFRGVPDMSLIEDVIASQHDADVAYAVIDGDLVALDLPSLEERWRTTATAGELNFLRVADDGSALVVADGSLRAARAAAQISAALPAGTRAGLVLSRCAADQASNEFSEAELERMSQGMDRQMEQRLIESARSCSGKLEG